MGHDTINFVAPRARSGLAHMYVRCHVRNAEPSSLCRHSTSERNERNEVRLKLHVGAYRTAADMWHIREARSCSHKLCDSMIAKRSNKPPTNRHLIGTINQSHPRGLITGASLIIELLTCQRRSPNLGYKHSVENGTACRHIPCLHVVFTREPCAKAESPAC